MIDMITNVLDRILKAKLCYMSGVAQYGNANLQQYSFYERYIVQEEDAFGNTVTIHPHNNPFTNAPSGGPQVSDDRQSFIVNTNTLGTSVNPNSHQVVLLGSGTTQPTKDDRTLESRITSGLTGTVISRLLSFNSSNMPVQEYKFSVTNSSNSNITISEIGLATQMQRTTTNVQTTGANSLNAPRCFFLIDRSLLSAPITLQPNESATIIYTVEFDGVEGFDF